MSTIQGIQLSSIGERLREERNRLGLNQADFGAIGGVQKQAQIKYERDERSPDASYLAAVAASGVDIAYVLTGKRLVSTPEPSISPRERVLLDNYRNTHPAQQQFIEQAAVMASQRVAAKGGDKR